MGGFYRRPRLRRTSKKPSKRSGKPQFSRMAATLPPRGCMTVFAKIPRFGSMYPNLRSFQT
jgi:hypothetical protein